MSRLFYIVSVKWTKRDDLYICFWRPNDSGYAWPLSWAGRYPEDRVRACLGYYNTGCAAIAVPCEVVDALAVKDTEPGYIDNDAGPVVPNNAKNWKALLANVIEPTPYRVRPQYKGASRRAVA